MDGPGSYDTLGVGPENVAASLAGLADRPDLVVVGHSHREMRDSVLNGVHFIQPKPYAQTLAVAHVDLVRDRHGLAGGAGRGASRFPWRRSNRPPGRFRRVAEPQDAVRIWVSTPLAIATGPMPGTDARVEATALITWINEVQRRQAGPTSPRRLTSTPAPGLPAG